MNCLPVDISLVACTDCAHFCFLTTRLFFPKVGRKYDLKNGDLVWKLRIAFSIGLLVGEVLWFYVSTDISTTLGDWERKHVRLPEGMSSATGPSCDTHTVALLPGWLLDQQVPYFMVFFLSFPQFCLFGSLSISWTKKLQTWISKKSMFVQ